MSRQINFTLEDTKKEYFTKLEYANMLEAINDNELFGTAAFITDKACVYLKFTEDQMNRWRKEMIDSISKSNHLVFFLAKMTVKEQKYLLKMTYLSMIQNYAEAEKNYQEPLDDLPQKE